MFHFHCVAKGNHEKDFWIIKTQDFEVQTCVELVCTLLDHCDNGDIPVKTVDEIREIFLETERMYQDIQAKAKRNNKDGTS